MTPAAEALLALSLVEGLGKKHLRALLRVFGHVEAILDASPPALCQAVGLHPDLAARIGKAREVDAFRMEMRLIEQHGIRLVTLADPDYPPLLLETGAPPPVLYTKGNIPLTCTLGIGVVGTRRCTRAGIKATRRLVADMATQAPELVVISGLARGVDTAAHQQALESGLATVAVLAGGLTSIYPPENAGLAESIAQHGALVTEFPMTSPPLGKNFPIRNRIISGLSTGLLVVEAGEKSGALITAGFALNQNREVFAVPGGIDEQNSRGTNRLIQKGQGKLVMDAADILEELPGFRREPSQQMELLETVPPPQGLKVRPEGEKGRVIAALTRGALHPDDLAEETELPVERLLGLLLELELEGEVVQTTENQYALS